VGLLSLKEIDLVRRDSVRQDGIEFSRVVLENSDSHKGFIAIATASVSRLHDANFTFDLIGEFGGLDEVIVVQDCLVFRNLSGSF